MADIKRQLDRIIWDKWSAGKKAELKPSELGWSQDTMPWKAEFKHNVADDQPFVYRAEGRYISFKPTGLWWTTPQGPSAIKQGVSTSLGSSVESKARYANALGPGISLEASVSRTAWRKEVTIDSLESLGTIPAEAEFLEVGFEIETDFDIEGWDKKSELKFNKAIRLSELSQLEAIKARDNHIILEPKEGEDPEVPFERCDGFLRVVEGRYYLVKRIPVEYLQKAAFPVITDTVITYGAEYVFNAALTKHVSCAALDSTHFVVCFMDDGGADHGIAMIGVVSSGDQIAYGAEYVFNAALTRYISCAALDATHFVVCFMDDGGADHGIAMIGVITGDAIAYGAEYGFNTAATWHISCAALDATHFVVGYEDQASTIGGSKIGVVTGDAIAFGAEYEFNAGHSHFISCAALDTTHFVVGYYYDSGYAKIGVVTGDAIAYGAAYAFNTGVISVISCAALDATHFVVAYRVAVAYHGRAQIGVVSSGDNIAYGAEYKFNAASTNYISCAALDSTHFVVCFMDDGGDDYGIAMIGVVTGDAIAYGAEYVFNAAATWYISCAATECATGISLGSNIFVVGFKDEGGDGDGIAMIGTRQEPEAALENKSANMGSKMVAAGLI